MPTDTPRPQSPRWAAWQQGYLDSIAARLDGRTVTNPSLLAAVVTHLREREAEKSKPQAKGRV